jgi:HTH-type transcriptional regulator, sugar sensing transcriptional regulator
LYIYCAYGRKGVYWKRLGFSVILDTVMPKSVEELLPIFKGLGITEYEAKVYLSLLTQHPSSAYTISQISMVPHSRVYDVTRRLINRGLVVSTGTKPEMFSPLSPDELVRKLEKEYRKYTTELEEKLADFKFHSDFDPVWNLADPEEVYETTVRILSEARRTVYVGIWEQDLERIEESLRTAENRGVKLFILLYGKRDMDFGTLYRHETENLPMNEVLGRSIDCTVDSRWCISGRFGKEEPCRVVWTRNKGLVHTVESYLRHDLYLAEIERDFDGEIERRYGKNLSSLREKFLG